MTLEEFIAYWSAHAHDESATERASAQSHFIGLCRALGLEEPRGPDYTFEKAVRKVGGGQGFADVWKRGHFAWEYKRAGSNLHRAYEQLTLYRDDLGNPPLLIVSDLLRFEVHTNFTGTNPKVHAFGLEELRDPANQKILRLAFTDPEQLNPKHQRRQVTEEATERVGAIARALVSRGHDPARVAHFMMQLVFSLFAEDVGLLPKGIMTTLLERGRADPLRLQRALSALFAAMSTGGDFGVEEIRHFNGGLFDGAEALPLEPAEIAALHEASVLDWADVEPHIFGTLFERSLDPNKRGQLGAHYTSREDILDVVEPVVLVPLREEWRRIRAEIEEYLAGPPRMDGRHHFDGTLGWGRKTQPRRSKRSGEFVAGRIDPFLRKLQTLRVLDPACGSGNFLYVTMQGLLDLQRDVLNFAAEIGEPPLRQFVSPEQFYGLEVNPFAYELASMVVWIGYLQWKRANGESNHDNPVLRKLNTIQLRDALLDPDGSEAGWPEADYIVGNPPFLGSSRMRDELGEAYTEALRRAYQGRVPGGADLVCYFFEKARAQIEAGRARRAGLIATNSVRQKVNRPVLERVLRTGGIFLAWPDRPWIQDGAAVRVSIVCFDGGIEASRTLCHFAGAEDDPAARQVVARAVARIHADLTGGPDLTRARPLRENAGRSFEGVKPAGPFDVPADVAEAWLDLPNPSGVSNRDVLRPYINGDDLLDRPSGRWIVDFQRMSLEEAARYRQPFAYVEQRVRPVRERNRDRGKRARWWLHDRPRPEMRAALEPLARYIVTPQTAKHRLFLWLDKAALPSSLLVVLAFDDDFSFGVLNSAPHVRWALAVGGTLEDRPRYFPSDCFETFPFPRPDESRREAVARAARHLEQVRQRLQQRTGLGLTQLYNALEGLRLSPDAADPVHALLDAHEQLDQAVAAAYGWEWPLSDEQILERLLKLNLERAAAEGLAEPECEPV
ncbi:hypothetical protein Mterra_00252 [Calidithermus terrae]|uniref:site-specific DNA-methyltransferase (adenine-specific) n=1 Tax=Calidithermus terrae TaxID=1408545 RepID=A0A399F3M3_9DEIN|nr:DNA methyltransferase [Calidithermus terrae]RIH90650.1 hypothetical protein Mterra_00252 [Calidithermus terrae]